MDLWPLLHPITEVYDDRGFTQDPTTNPNLRDKRHKAPVRIDRIMCRQEEDSCLQPQSIRIIGKEAITDILGGDMASEEAQVRPSDHYGLFAEFAIHL